MFARKLKRQRAGSSIVETAAGLIFLIPVLLILVDVAALVLTQTANDALAKQCARAAAVVPVAGSTAGVTETQAAQACYTSYFTGTNALNGGNQQTSSKSMIQQLPVATGCVVTFPTPSTAANPGTDTVKVQTTVTCALPVPVPFVNVKTVQFAAFSTEPVVGQMP